MSWNLSDYANLAQVVSVPLAIILWIITREHFAKFWKKWFKYILTFLVGLTLLGMYHFGWLAWLAYPVRLPIWALLLMVLCPFGLGVFIWALVNVPANVLTRQLSPRDYNEASIFGVNWQWTYDENIIKNPQAFCPSPGCHCRLDAVDNYGTASIVIIPVSLICPHCRFRHDYDWPAEELDRRVGLEIERRIRSGEWRTELEHRQSQPV